MTQEAFPVNAAPFQVIGANGVGQLPTPVLPSVPDIQVQDNTAELIARQNESINRAYEYTQTQIETTRNTTVEQASTISRNSFGNALSGVVAAVGQGYEIYQGIQEGKRAEELARLEIDQATAAAAAEDIIRNQIVGLHRDIGKNASDEGVIQTYTQMLRRTRAEFEGKVPPEVLQTIVNVGWDALTEAQKEQGVRWVNEFEDTQAAVRDQNAQQLQYRITPILQQMAHGSMMFNPQEGEAAIAQEISSFLETNNIVGIDALHVLRSIYPSIIAASETYGMNTANFNQQQTVLADVLQRAYEANEVYNQSPEQRNAVFAQLQLELEAAGVPATLSTIFQTERERFLANAEVEKTIRDLTPEANGYAEPLNDDERFARSVLVTSSALAWLNDPNGFALEIENASGADAPLEQRAIYRQYEQLQDDKKELSRVTTEAADILPQVEGARAEIEAVLDKIDPDNRIGRPQTILGYVNVLQTVRGEQQNSEISDALSGALQTAQNAEIQALEVRYNDLQRQERELIASWSSYGIDLRNTTDTSGIQAQLSYTEPTRAAMQTRIQQQRFSGSDPNFGWGLPQLPSR